MDEAFTDSGSAVTVYGAATDSWSLSLDTVDDNVDPPPPGDNTGIIYSNTDLEQGFHRIIINGLDESNDTAPSEFRLDEVVVGSIIGDPR